MKLLVLPFCCAMYLCASIVALGESPCDVAIDRSRTEITVHTKKELVDKVMTYYESHHNQTSDSTFGLGIGAVVPIDGVPTPMNLNANQDDFRRQLDDLLMKYERDYHYNFEQDTKISFVPGQAFDVWIRCIGLTVKNVPLQIEDSSKMVGRTAHIDMYLRQNYAPTRITSLEIRANGQTYTKQDLIRKGILKPSQNSLTESSHFAFSFDVRGGSDFDLYLVTDRYAPVSIYFPGSNRTSPYAGLEDLQVDSSAPGAFTEIAWVTGSHSPTILESSGTIKAIASRRIVYTIDTFPYYNKCLNETGFKYRFKIFFNDKDTGEVIQNNEYPGYLPQKQAEDPKRLVYHVVAAQDGRADLRVDIEDFQCAGSRRDFTLYNSTIRVQLDKPSVNNLKKKTH